MVVLPDQEVVEAVPIMTGGLHGYGNLPGSTGLVESGEDLLKAFGVVVERLRSSHEGAVSVEDAGHVLSLGHVDAAETRVPSWRFDGG